MSFEDEYLDVLQNIEFAIVNVYRKHRDLTDYDVERAVDALIVRYQAEQRKRTPQPARLSDIAAMVVESVSVMCEWRLGRVTQSNLPKMPEDEALSLEELIACLKRIRKSVQLWTKQGGRRGYLDFVEQYLP
jgi:hypothetical protein